MVEELYIGNMKAVVSDFNVVVTGDYESVITWASTNIEVLAVSALGVVTVTRPLDTEPLEVVTLTASIKVGTVTQTKVFVCTVLPEGMSDAQAVAADKVWTINSLGGIDLGTRKADLILPTEGPNESLITWTSADSTIIKITL